MFSLRFLTRWTDMAFVKRYLHECLFFSLFFAADLVLTLILSQIFGLPHVMLALLAGNFTLFLLLLAGTAASVRAIRLSYGQGRFPSEAFNNLSVLLFSAFLLLSPGFLSLLFALLICGPGKKGFSKLIAKKLSIDWKDVYEYLKLEDGR